MREYGRGEDSVGAVCACIISYIHTCRVIEGHEEARQTKREIQNS